MSKRLLGMDVLTAARQRVARVFDDFQRICCSFSGGKDSSVMLHLVMEEARRRGRRVGLLFVDLEAQYRLTIDYVSAMFDDYADNIDPYWITAPLILRNAVSQYEPRWMCWEPGRDADWVRPRPEGTLASLPFSTVGMEFEEFVVQFAEWFAAGEPAACFVGIRTAESLNRWRAITMRKESHAGLPWMTRIVADAHNAYPIYDWSTEDIWTYFGRFRLPYNRLYDRMHGAGLSIHQARICQPYGDDQRKGLWLFQVIEPETWARVVARVNGANQGALYARESGNITGVRTVSKPPHLTWEQFAHMLLASMPEHLAEHYRNKVHLHLKWYRERGVTIPDAGSPVRHKGQGSSWTRICKALLRNDYWCKGLSFQQTMSGSAYDKYSKRIKKQRDAWGLI